MEPLWGAISAIPKAARCPPSLSFIVGELPARQAGFQRPHSAARPCSAAGVTTSSFAPSYRGPSAARNLLLESTETPNEPRRHSSFMPRRQCTRRAASQSSAPNPTAAYQFIDEGPTVEIRVRLPLSEEPIEARHVAVDAQRESLHINVNLGSTSYDSSSSSSTLLVAHPLYAPIVAADTVWLIDGDEVVVHLRKAASTGEDPAAAWPGLVQEWAALAADVARQLKSCSVYLVGPCSGAVKSAIAQDLASGLGYAPLQTDQILLQVSGSTAAHVLQMEGPHALAEAETSILQSLSTIARTVVSCIAGEAMSPFGTATDGRWKFLHGGFVVWLEMQGSGCPAEVDPTKVDAAVRLGISEKDWTAEMCRSASEGIVKALRAVIANSPELPGKKSLYVRLGCRGDWPDLMPPGWDPGAPAPAEHTNAK